MDISSIIDALQKETIYCPEKESLKMLLGRGQQIIVPAKEFILTPGITDSNVYLVMEGMIRLGWYDDNREVTYGFGGACSFFLSPKGLFANTESYFFIVANTDCTIMKWSKAVFREILAESHDLSQFFFYIALGQFYSTEMKASVIKGSAKSRYENLVKNPDQKKLNVLSKRPNLLQSVSSKDLASYLGVSPSYLSNIRKKSLSDERAKSTVNGVKIGAKTDKNGAIIDKNTANISSRQQNVTPQERILDILDTSPTIKVGDVAKQTGLSVRSVKYHISSLKASGVLSREGNNRTGRWIVNK